MLNDEFTYISFFWSLDILNENIGALKIIKIKYFFGMFLNLGYVFNQYNMIHELKINHITFINI